MKISFYDTFIVQTLKNLIRYLSFLLVIITFPLSAAFFRELTDNPVIL